MKKLLLLLFIAPVLGFGQGEKRYAYGTSTDQEGNALEAQQDYDSSNKVLGISKVVKQ